MSGSVGVWIWREGSVSADSEGMVVVEIGARGKERIRGQTLHDDCNSERYSTSAGAEAAGSAQAMEGRYMNRIGEKGQGPVVCCRARWPCAIIGRAETKQRRR